MPKHFQIWKFLKVRLNMCITGLVIWTNLCLCCLLFVRLKSIHCQEPNTGCKPRTELDKMCFIAIDSNAKRKLRTFCFQLLFYYQSSRKNIKWRVNTFCITTKCFYFFYCFRKTCFPFDRNRLFVWNVMVMKTDPSGARPGRVDLITPFWKSTISW